MEVLSMQSITLPSAHLNHGSLPPEIPPASRTGFISRDFSRRRSLQGRLSLSTVPSLRIPSRPRPSKVPFAHSSLESFTDNFLCKSDLGSRTDLGNPIYRAEQDHEFLLRKRALEIVTELRGTRIFLLGMMGSGKTTVGKVLAQALGYEFVDSDKLIEDAAGGMSVAQIFQELHEDGFRDAETQALKQVSCRSGLIVATGGGIVVRPVNWKYLRQGITIWLDVPLQALAERVVAAGTESRPLLGQTAGDSAHSQALLKLSTIFDSRGPFYANADARVSLYQMASHLGCEGVDALKPAMVSAQVLEEISKVIKREKHYKPGAAA